MNRFFIRWCSVFLLIFPLVATADPVKVNATIAGTMTADAVWLGKFTDDLNHTGGYYPFTFTLSGEFDPASPGFQSMPYGEGQRIVQLSPDVVATMTIDGIEYPIAGGAFLEMYSTPAYLTAVLHYTDGSESWSFAVGVLDSTNSLSTDPLAPRELTAGGSLTGYFSSDAFPLNPDAGGMWSAWATTNNASITISAIPEPSHAGMLATGLFILLVACRKQIFQGSRRY
jgi:hypothetical protein